MKNYQLPINLSCILGPLSYGKIGINILRKLDNLGLNVCLFPIGPIDVPQENFPLIQKCLQNADTYNRQAASVRIQQQFDLANHIGRGRHIGFPVFELDCFNQRELTHLRNQDKLVVCSSFNKEILLQNKILNDEDIHICELGVDRSIYYPEQKEYKFQGEPTTFINVSKWELRKSHWELLEYYESAFDVNSNVRLVMLTGSLILENRLPDEIKKWKKMYMDSPLSSKITIIDWLPNEKMVADYLRKSDCFISLSKAEGFGLGGLEAQSCALPCIMSRYGGHLTYCDDQNSMLVDMGEMELGIDNVFFDGRSGGRWRGLNETSREQTIEYMRSIHKRKQSGENLFNQAGIETACKFSWESAAKKLVEIL